jgi:hypothetical protein
VELPPAGFPTRAKAEQAANRLRLAELRGDVVLLQIRQLERSIRSSLIRRWHSSSTWNGCVSVANRNHRRVGSQSRPCAQSHRARVRDRR